ncbi:hypothetical protein MASR2M52_19320 [Pedobacter sp.]
MRLYSANPLGTVLSQRVFTAGQRFGEPPFFSDRIYPSTAQANIDSVIIKIKKEHFFNLLNDYPEFIRKMMYCFAERIYNKSTSVRVWVQQTPGDKIKQFLSNTKSFAMGDCNSEQLLPYTRQQIADFTGLRVETVIRTLSRMSKDGKVKIINHKLYY